MKTTRLFTLDRPARKAGGDRYQERVPEGQKPIMNQTYVDQSVSRSEGSAPLSFLEISIETEVKDDDSQPS